MNCVDCADIDPIEDQGELKLRPCSDPLAAAIRNAGYEAFQTSKTCIIPYHRKEELLKLIEMLVAAKDIADSLSVCVKSKGAPAAPDRWLTFDQLKVRFANENLVSIIMSHDFCSHMQPIVNFSEEIVGFEFFCCARCPRGVIFSPTSCLRLPGGQGFTPSLTGLPGSRR
ncbi:hypothetical protein ACFTAO_50925 [Paenibacillus rhizoplanae]